MRRALIPFATAAAVAAVVLPNPAGAATDTIRAKVAPTAQLVEGGGVRVTIDVWCAPFGEPFETNVGVSQDGGAISGRRSLPFVPCDRRWHSVTAVVRPFDGAFHRGRAFVSAYVSRVDNSTGEMREANAVRTVLVR